MTQNHTPTPYMVEPINNGATYQLTTCEATGFAVVAETPVDLVNGKEQAEFMKRACNAHDDLVAALEGILRFDACWDDRKKALEFAIATLSKAKAVQ